MGFWAAQCSNEEQHYPWDGPKEETEESASDDLAQHYQDFSTCQDAGHSAVTYFDDPDVS